MSEQNMKIVRRLLGEVWTEGNIALLPELLAAIMVNDNVVCSAVQPRFEMVIRSIACLYRLQKTLKHNGR